MRCFFTNSRIYSRRQCSSICGAVSKRGRPTQRSYPFPHVEPTYAICRQGQSFRLFCPLGQKHRGVENPRLFKDRPTDGKSSGCAAHFLISAFAIAWATVHCETRCDMVLRIILLPQRSSTPCRNADLNLHKPSHNAPSSPP